MKSARAIVLGLAALLLVGDAPRVRADDDAAERAGRELAAELRSLSPAEGITHLATLRLRTRSGTTQLPLRVEVETGPQGWSTRYSATPPDGATQTLVITVTPDGTNRYEWAQDESRMPVDSTARYAPFAGSDFWPADLGMEFLHWPVQRLLKKELRRGQACNKLESLAPPGHTNGYVRVVSWFDIDTGGPVICEAYDARGKLVKEFKPNAFSRVNGRWQVEELEMRDLRTGSRSWIRFDLQPAAPDFTVTPATNTVISPTP